MVKGNRGWSDDYWLDEGNTRSILVLEDDDSPQKTGLVDSSGRDIYRFRYKIPMGFQPPPRAENSAANPCGKCGDGGKVKTVKVRRKGKKG